MSQSSNIETRGRELSVPLASGEMDGLKFIGMELYVGPGTYGDSVGIVLAGRDENGGAYLLNGSCRPATLPLHNLQLEIEPNKHGGSSRRLKGSSNTGEETPSYSELWPPAVGHEVRLNRGHELRKLHKAPLSAFDPYFTNSPEVVGTPRVLIAAGASGNLALATVITHEGIHGLYSRHGKVLKKSPERFLVDNHGVVRSNRAWEWNPPNMQSAELFEQFDLGLEPLASRRGLGARIRSFGRRDGPGRTVE